MSQASTPAAVRNVVLVHGGFVDGSGWEGVVDALKRDGYTVTIVQKPTTSLAGEIKAAVRALEGIQVKDLMALLSRVQVVRAAH